MTMTRDEIVEMLKENITIEVDVGRDSGWDYREVVRVKLLFDGEVICQGYDTISEHRCDR